LRNQMATLNQGNQIIKNGGIIFLQVMNGNKVTEDINKASESFDSNKTADKEKSREAMRSIVLRWIESEDEKIKKHNIEEESVVKDDRGKRIIEARSFDIATVEKTEREKETIHKARQPKALSVKKREQPSGEMVDRRERDIPEFHVTPSLLPRRKVTNGLAVLYSFIWVTFIAGIMILSFGVYKLGWNDPLTNQLLNYVPLPYGFVRYHPIWYSIYRQEYQAISRFRGQQAVSTRLTVSPEEIEGILLRRTIANDLAWSNGLWVTSEEVEGEFDSIASRAGSTEEVERAIQSLWGYSLDEYKQRVIRPYLLKKKLFAVLAANNLLRRKTSEANDLQVLDAYLDGLRASTPVVLFR